MAQKKDNTLLWVLGLAAAGTAGYFIFVKPKADTNQQLNLPGASSKNAEVEIAKAKAAEARAKADQYKAAADGQRSVADELMLGIPGFLTGIATGIFGG